MREQDKLVLDGLRQESTKSPLLVVIVGWSAVGKSTFCQALDCDGCWYVSSRPIIKLVEEKKLEVNHDTIHACACEAYENNPAWQVPLILGAMEGRGYLLLDGPRRIGEVKALIQQHPNTLVVRITASEEARRIRLGSRDGVDEAGFQRVLEDEAGHTELNQILELAQIVVENDGRIQQITAEANEFRGFLDSLEEDNL